MENRIELERRGLNKSEVVELVLDNCRSTSIIGLTDEYCHLEKLSLINVGLTSLKGLPSLPRLRKIELSDNRITSGLEYLLKTPQLTHLSLSGNKIKDIASLAPLAKLSSLKSLDLFNCDVTTEKEYRNKVFELIPQLKFLDGADRDQEELEDTEEEGDDEEVDEEDDEDDELQSEGTTGKGEKEEADEDAEDDAEDDDEPNPEGGADVDEEEEGESDEEDEQNQLQGDIDEEEEDELDDEDEDNEPGLDYLNKDDFSDEDEDGDFAPGEGEDDDDDDEEIDEEATEEEHATRGTKRKHEGDEDA